MQRDRGHRIGAERRGWLAFDHRPKTVADPVHYLAVLGQRGQHGRNAEFLSDEAADRVELPRCAVNAQAIQFLRVPENTHTPVELCSPQPQFPGHVPSLSSIGPPVALANAGQPDLLISCKSFE